MQKIISKSFMPSFLSSLLRTVSRACVLLCSLVLVSCPSAFGFFPDPADRLPFSSVTSNVSVTSAPVWFSRTIGADTWVAITTDTITLGFDSEIMAESANPTAQVYFRQGRDSNENINFPNSNITEGETQAIGRDRPVRIRDRASALVETFTAISIAPQELPSNFITLSVNIEGSQALAPEANLASGFYNFPLTISLHSNTQAEGVDSEGNPVSNIYYTMTVSTAANVDAETPPTPSISSENRYTAPIMLPATVNSADVYQYRIRAITAEAGVVIASPVSDFIYTRFGSE